MLYAKAYKVHDRKYLDTFRFKSCSASALLGCYGDVVAAHNSFRTDAGKGTKASDCFVSPLCFHHHGEEGNRGQQTFWHCILAEDTELLFELRRKAQLFDYACYLFKEKRGEDINRLFREWGMK